MRESGRSGSKGWSQLAGKVGEEKEDGVVEGA